MKIVCFLFMYSLFFLTSAYADESLKVSAIQLQERAKVEGWKVIHNEVMHDDEKRLQFLKGVGSANKDWLNVYEGFSKYLDGIFSYLAYDALASAFEVNAQEVFLVTVPAINSDEELEYNLRYCGMTEYDLENETPINEMMPDVFRTLYKQRDSVSRVTDPDLDQAKILCKKQIEDAILNWFDYGKNVMKNPEKYGKE